MSTIVIDRETFIEICTALEGASQSVLDATRSLCPIAESPYSDKADEWLPVIDALMGTNQAVSRLELLLKAVVRADLDERRTRSLHS
jgi:hypothetical protein